MNKPTNTYAIPAGVHRLEVYLYDEDRAIKIRYDDSVIPLTLEQVLRLAEGLDTWLDQFGAITNAGN